MIINSSEWTKDLLFRLRGLLSYIKDILDKEKEDERTDGK